MKTAFVYSGPHYGRKHNILSRSGSLVWVEHRGDKFAVPYCDVEECEPVKPKTHHAKISKDDRALKNPCSSVSIRGLKSSPMKFPAITPENKTLSCPWPDCRSHSVHGSKVETQTTAPRFVFKKETKDGDIYRCSTCGELVIYCEVAPGWIELRPHLENLRLPMTQKQWRVYKWACEQSKNPIVPFTTAAMREAVAKVARDTAKNPPQWIAEFLATEANGESGKAGR